MRLLTRQHPLLLLIAVIAALAAYPLIAWAQSEVLLMGQDSSGNLRIVLVDSSGRLSTTGSVTNSVTGSFSTASHGACTNTTMNVGTTGTACPATARADRTSILIQLVQTGETLTITSDGATTATATAGVQISSGSSYGDDLDGTVSTSCRCSAATCSVRIVECP